MIRFLGIGACAASIAFGGPAAAGPLSAEAPAEQIVLPNSGPRVARSYHVGDAVLELPLRWASAATLGQAATIEVDGASEQLPAGTVLALQQLAEAGGPSVRAYCTPRRAAERATDRGLLAAPLFRLTLRPILRSSTDRQLCLIDSDGDGRADRGLVVGDGSPEARTPHGIAPVPLDVADLVPSSGQDRVRIVLTRVHSRGEWAEFEIQIQQQGHNRFFETIGGPWGSSTRVSRVAIAAKSPGAPTEASILGADFAILAIDPQGRSARIQWPDAADANRSVTIPDGLRIIYR